MGPLSPARPANLRLALASLLGKGLSNLVGTEAKTGSLGSSTGTKGA